MIKLLKNFLIDCLKDISQQANYKIYQWETNEKALELLVYKKNIIKEFIYQIYVISHFK